MNVMEYQELLRYRPPQQQAPILNHPQGGNIMGEGELEDDPMPQAPNPYATVGDPSSMGSYGMQAPPLQDPMSQMKNLMSMNQPQQRAAPAPGGNLMDYIMMLAGGG